MFANNIGWVHPTVRKGHLIKLAVFRCLSTAATENNDRSKGTIINQDNSGTAGVEATVGEEEKFCGALPLRSVFTTQTVLELS